ncbi:MAG: NAD(P)H-hydrate dehydratase [Planctomycetota bacterium]
MNDVTSTPLPELPTREADSHKGDYGRVLVIGGSRGMAGAPALAGMAALRSGAGLVTVAVPRSIQSTVASFEPSYMTVGFGDANEAGLSSESHFELGDMAHHTASVVALGPGMGTSEELHTKELVHDLYAEVPHPMVVDADGLNALAANTQVLSIPGGPRILTPHPGEFRRLSGQQYSANTDSRVAQAKQLCELDAGADTTVVLKGNQSIVVDREKFAVNATGNPGMATGGTGDCLTGVITSLVGQGLSPFDAARLGVHVHGLAGDLAAAELGQTSMIASDLIRFLPAAFEQLDSQRA